VKGRAGEGRGTREGAGRYREKGEGKGHTGTCFSSLRALTMSLVVEFLISLGHLCSIIGSASS